MNDFIILLVEYLRQHSLWFLGALIILQNNGAPLGSSLVVMAAGALAYYGEFSILSLWVYVWIFAILGDSTSYWLWKKAGQALLTRSPRINSLVGPSVQKAEIYNDRYGIITVLLSRFPLSPLGTFVNIFAGTSGFKYLPFFITAALGEMLWVSFYLGTGYWFGDSYEQIALLIRQIGQLGFLILALVAALYFAWSFIKTRDKRKKRDLPFPFPDLKNH